MAMESQTHLTDIATVLKSLGVDVRRADGREISGRCPVHHRVTGREDRSPSWSMNAETGLWLCFSCGARGTLSMLIAELSDEPDAVLAVHKFLIERNLERITFGGEPPEKRPEVDWVTYSKFSPVPKRQLRTRHLDPDVARLYGIKWDDVNSAWIIPIVDQFGDLLGWQSKAKSAVRNFPIGIKKSHSLFGLERFTGATAVLMESPLDVVRMASAYTKPVGLATFGAHVSDRQIYLLSLVADRLIVAMDNDEAGLLSSKKLFKSLPKFRRGVKWWNYEGTSAKDIGEMSDDEIAFGLATSTIIPPWVK